MPTSSTHPPCYCVAGHGRSGSSLIAALLRSGGVDVGRRLMAGGPSNPRGHFEDLDFYDLHVAVLKAQGLRDDGFVVTPRVPVPAEFVPTAERLVADRRRAGRPWGWKEPRTTLFLDFWRDLVPELRFVFLIRPPWEIIDSLFRRGDPVYRQHPALAVRVLESYNRAVLDFHDRFPDRSVIVESVAAAARPDRFADALAARFGHAMTFAAGVYEPDLIHRDAAPAARRLLGHFFPEAVDQYQRMRERAAVALPDPAGKPDDPADLDWALRHWADQRAAEAEVRRAPAAADAAAGAAPPAESVLYVDTGGGYNAAECRPAPADPRGERFDLAYDLTGFPAVREVRWDPVELHLCRVWLESVAWQDAEGREHAADLARVRSNGRAEADGALAFETLDPMVFLPVAGDVRRVTVRGRWHVADLHTSAMHVSNLLQQRVSEVEALRAAAG